MEAKAALGRLFQRKASRRDRHAANALGLLSLVSNPFKCSFRGITLCAAHASFNGEQRVQIENPNSDIEPVRIIDIFANGN
jgi:hypothetical protein